MTRAIRKSLTVPLRRSAAFHLFAERLGDWWPVGSDSVSAGEGALPRRVEATPARAVR